MCFLKAVWYVWEINDRHIPNLYIPTGKRKVCSPHSWERNKYWGYVTRIAINTTTFQQFLSKIWFFFLNTFSKLLAVYFHCYNCCVKFYFLEGELLKNVFCLNWSTSHTHTHTYFGWPIIHIVFPLSDGILSGCQ